MNIKDVDSLLSIKKQIDGQNKVVRKSSRMKGVTFDVIDLSNTHVGSMLWLKLKLQSMDSHRIDFFQSTLNENYRKKYAKIDDRQNREVADFIFNGEKIVI